MSENVIDRDERGLAGFGDFQFTWHGKVYVQESSIAFRGACVWVRSELSYSNNPKEHPPVLHLSYHDAKELRDALTRFLNEAEADGLVEAVPAERPTPYA